MFTTFLNGLGRDLFNHNLKCALRSKFLGYLPEIMHNKTFMTSLAHLSKTKTKKDDLKWLGPPINLFGPIDILNGHSVIEFFDNEFAV